MRDIIVTLIILAALAYTFKKAYVGILLWSWLGYMNPHRLCWGFAYTQPFSQMTAVVTLLSLLASKEDKSLPKDKIVFLMLFFICWIGITTNFAFHPEAAQEEYMRILKIDFPIILTMLMFKNKERLHQLLWVIVFSIGFFGIKGGLFTIAKGGAARVFGPPDSFLEENNALAVALLMIMPLMFYLKTTLSNIKHQQILMVCITLIAFSVLGSQSRGAFLGLSAVGGYFWLQTKNKVKPAILLLLFVGVAYAFLPDSWYQRMNTINTYQEDESANGRLNAWELAFNVANHNPLGGGLGLWSGETYLKYLPGFDPRTMNAFVAHSIYFSVLGEQGWFGLLQFLLILFLTWSNCRNLERQCRGVSHLQWVGDLARMIKVSLLAYCTGGAFLSLSYLDLPWHLIAISVVLKEIVRTTPKDEQVAEPVSSPGGKPPVKVRIDANGYIR